MKINDLKNKKIAILGLGVENYFLIKYLLKKKLECRITVCDKRNSQQLGDNKYIELSKFGIEWKLEADFNHNLGVFDVLFRSPGWPIACPGITQALKLKSILYSSMSFFLDLCPTRNTIGVTGTKGKGTTSSLIYQILKTAGKKVWLGGNIGVAPFEFIEKISKDDYVVLELSSFQLEDMQKSPHIAVVTNFSKEHLAPADPNNPNYHRTTAKYWAAKANIFRWQKKGDYLILNSNFQFSIFNFQTIFNKSISQFSKLQNQIIGFDKSDLVTSLPGEHNKENIAAAVEVARVLKIDEKFVIKAVKNFKGLEHRIEKVVEVDGVEYFDDSFATTPDSSIIALKSFSNSVILLAGGADKGADFKKYAKEIKKRVKFLVLFQGLGSERIIAELRNVNYDKENYIVVDSMSKAIIMVQKKAVAGDTVLLSPGCASFGVFKSYKERGDLFKQAVKNL